MSRSPAIGAVVAILQVAAVYTYFLLFDQFGFLHHLHRQGLDAGQVRLVMMAMGLGGLVGSFATARLVDFRRVRRQLSMAWAACAAAALISVGITSVSLLAAEGLVIGLTTGAITVLVAASLRELVSGTRLGLCIGIGTGFAYVLANTPVLFDGSLARIAGVSVALSLASCGMVLRYLASSDGAGAAEPASNRSALWPWVLGLAVLVWMDSGAFAMIQQDAALKAWTWGPAGHKLGLALAHGGAAVIAGFLLDRGLRFSMVLATWMLFALAFSVIPHGPPDAFPASLIYACGISLYSVVLVAMPSLVGGDLRIRAMQAAWLFGISGWVGSALGVGMAQGRVWIPGWFLPISGAALLILLIILNPLVLRRARRTFGASSLVLLLCALWLSRANEERVGRAYPLDESSTEAVRRGAEVYRAEGCINCHSQYVRPGERDESVWGPYSPIDRTEQPPFVGNRRQGPDLKNAGLRRSAQWHRVHLIDPVLLSPGSRMPYYAHLFAEGRTDGDDLVAYLMTRGKAMKEEYLRRISTWSPQGIAGGSADRGEVLFLRQCSVCHGPGGRGDGPAAKLFDPAPRDLTTSAYAMVTTPDHPGDPLSVALARIIKFGLLGTSMPGHELLTDRDIADIVHFVSGLGPAGEVQP